MRKLFPSWGLVAIAIALALSQPLFLLVIWYFKIDKGTIKDANELGSIMGAIFTAGGLIIAIVSIYTMASIESVAQRAVAPLFDQIPREIDARIRRFLEGFGYFTRAQGIVPSGYSAEYLDTVESLVGRALEIAPTITGIYAFTSHVYYLATASMYWRERVPEQYVNYPLPSALAFASVSARALWWSQQALERSDGEAGEIIGRLAMLSGMMHASIGATLSYVRRAREAGKPIEAVPSNLLKLLGSCSSQADIERLSRELDGGSPLDVGAIEALLLQNEPKREPGAGVPLNDVANAAQLLVVRHFDVNDGRFPVSPGMLLILYGAPGKALARWRRRVQTGIVVQNDGIPSVGEIDPSTGASASPAPIAIDELAKELCRDFYVFSRFTSHPAN